MKTLAEYINFDINPIESSDFRKQCKRALDENGVLRLDKFLTSEAVDSVRREGESHAHLAYYTRAEHNVYLQQPDTAFDISHARNRVVSSSKGCITTDQIPESSVLKLSLIHI